MNWLEARFRRKFEPEGDRYRFRQVDREVIFDRATVEQLVAEWRKTWLNPWLWGSLAVFGIAVPLAAGSAGVIGWEPLLVLAILVWITCAVLLAVAQQPVQDAAFARESVGPGTRRTVDGWKFEVFWMFLMLMQLSMVHRDSFLGDWVYLLWAMYAFALLVFSVRLALRLLRHWRGVTPAG